MTPSEDLDWPLSCLPNIQAGRQSGRLEGDHEPGGLEIVSTRSALGQIRNQKAMILRSSPPCNKQACEDRIIADRVRDSPFFNKELVRKLDENGNFSVVQGDCQLLRAPDMSLFQITCGLSYARGGMPLGLSTRRPTDSAAPCSLNLIGQSRAQLRRGAPRLRTEAMLCHAARECISLSRPRLLILPLPPSGPTAQQFEDIS